jgi:CheY-like chemotaxis protein
MDGFEFIDHLRTEPGYSHATIMMLTSSGRAQDANRCRSLGVSQYLVKPIYESELLCAVLQAMGSVQEVTTCGCDEEEEIEDNHVPYRILLAEDNLVNQHLAVTLLNKLGHSVAVGRDGQEALQKWEEEKFDLLLLDVQMPELDGFGVTAAIRAKERKTGKHVAIVAMTAHAMKGDRERCLSAGMDDYIAKPITKAALHTVIQRCGPKPPAERTSSMESSAINREQALAGVGGDTELLLEIAKIFMDQADTMLAAVEETVRKQDAPALERAAHSLKGSVGVFGAQAAKDSAFRLEQMGRNRDLGAAQQACESLSRELQLVKQDLLRLQREFSGNAQAKGQHA